MRHWECESNENSFLVIDPKGKPATQFRLPGEPGFDDVRGVDLVATRTCRPICPDRRRTNLPRDREGEVGETR